MSSKTRFCVLCKRYERNNRSKFTRIFTVERAEKLLEGYRRRYNGEELNQPILHQLVHHKCYNKIVEGVSLVDQSVSPMNIVTSIEKNHGEKQDQISVIQICSRTPIPLNVSKRVLERRGRACAICNHYRYSSHDKMKRVVSNFMANKLAEGFHNKYGRPYGQSLLDAYIHETCYNKLYKSYQHYSKKAAMNQNRSRYQQDYARQSLCSSYETQSCSSRNESFVKSEPCTLEIAIDETSNLSTDSLPSVPYHQSMATINPTVELGALSDLFRPCIQQLTPEEIEFYTRRNPIRETMREDNTLTTDQLSIDHSSIIPPSTINDSMIYSNQHDHDYGININEQDKSPSSHLMFHNQQKMCAAAKIRRRYLKPPPLSKPTNPLLYDQVYLKNDYPLKPPIDIEELYDWLIEELHSSEIPISMGEVLKKHSEFMGGDKNPTSRESFKRERLKNRLEKFYPNQFIFVIPMRREGTFIALNDINHYIRLAIKNAKQEKEKAFEASILPSAVVPPTPVDLKRQTCEQIMSGIRKIRLYIRDPEQIHSLPSLLMQNVIGLITTSEKQFDKISHQYDFYRMIDEDLFDNGNNQLSNKPDKNLRNISLASDLISARHDNRISQKHFLLADELTKKDFRCTPKQVITLLNRYGHTCSYKSYIKMKILRQQAISELGEELERMMADEAKSSNS